MAQNKKSNKKKAPKWNGNNAAALVKEKEIEMFLMLTQKVEAKDVIAAMKEKGMSGLDVWESMGVFSLDTKADESVDFAELNIAETFVDSSDLSFLKNRNIQSIFSFAATEQQLGVLKSYFQVIVEIFGGFVCTDSDDFQPMVEL